MQMTIDRNALFLIATVYDNLRNQSTSEHV